MSAFEDFVNLELPKRPPMLTLANTGYDNDPNLGGAPAVVQNSPQGTYFFRNTGNILYVKNTSSPGAWAVVGSGGGTTAPLTWHVETTGNDVTGDGSVGAPFATPAGAFAKLASTYGERIKHLVKILVGIGNFPGFLIKGWEMDPADTTLPCGIQVIGTLVAPTLGGGTASGAFTAVTPGNQTTDVAYAVLTDSSQAWVPNALRGYLLEVLTGTSTLQMIPIVANTATTVTVLTSGIFGSVGGTYAIRDFGSVINTTVPLSPSIPAANAVAAPVSQQTAIGIYNAEVAPQIVEIRLEQIKVNPTGAPSGANGISIQGEAATVVRCFIGGTGTTQAARVNVVGGVGTINVSQSIIVAPAATTAIGSSGTGQQNFIQNLITGNLAVPNGTTIATAVSVNGFATVLLNQTLMESCSFGVPVSGQNVVSLSGVTINSGGSQCIRCRVIEGNSGASFFFGTGVKCNGGSVGIEVQGPAFATLTGFFSTGSTYGITVSQGAKIRLGGTDSYIVSAGLGEIILDDFGAPTTLANLRAQTPDKILSNAFGSYIWEA